MFPVGLITHQARWLAGFLWLFLVSGIFPSKEQNTSSKKFKSVNISSDPTRFAGLVEAPELEEGVSRIQAHTGYMSSLEIRPGPHKLAVGGWPGRSCWRLVFHRELQDGSRAVWPPEPLPCLICFVSETH